MNVRARTNSCGGSPRGCVFAKALQARVATCGLSERHALGERERVVCRSLAAREGCDALAALMHERARFALRLPGSGQLLKHSQAMRMQCGGLAGLRQAVAAHDGDVQHVVDLAARRDGGLAGLPWDMLVASMRAWAPRRRRPPEPR
jgi:hypothetical protein